MLGKRLVELYEELRKKNILKTKEEFSKILRIEYKNLSKYFRDDLKYEINQQNYDNINSLNVNIEWLLTGNGEMFKETGGAGSDYDKIKKENEELKKKLNELSGAVYFTQKENGDIVKNHVSDCIDKDDIYFIDLLPHKASAGPGQEMSQINILDTLPILKELVFNPDAKAIEARGDSMTGISIFDGDIIFFKPGIVRGDGLYILRSGSDIFIKRLIFDYVSNKISIISENKLYPEDKRIKEVDNNPDLICIEGKVIGWIHKHPY